jgi:hypothetical protein
MNNIDTLNACLALEPELSKLPHFQKNVKLYILYKKIAYLYKLILGDHHDLVTSYEGKAYVCLLNIPNGKWQDSLAVNIPKIIDKLPVDVIPMQLINPETL